MTVHWCASLEEHSCRFSRKNIYIHLLWWKIAEGMSFTLVRQHKLLTSTTMDRKHASLEDISCQKYVASKRCPLSPLSHAYSLSWASVRKAVKLYESLSFTLVREHGLIASEASMLSRLTASNAINYHVLHEAKICPSADLCSHDNNRHGAHIRSFLIT